MRVTARRRAAKLTDIDLGPIKAPPLAACEEIKTQGGETLAERTEVEETLAKIGSIMQGLMG